MSAGQVAAHVVRGYQMLVRPLLPAACRFVPGCSEYVREALVEHGLLRGILRCHPWNAGGYDPPPARRSRG